MQSRDGSVVNVLDDQHDDEDLEPTLPLGFVIAAKYQIKRVLGVGGNGAVYEGQHTDVGHRVAIKVAHRKLDDRGDIMSRFRREARICGSLRHPHVGQVFDVGTLDDGAPYMVMELQEGRSLADAIDETSLPVAAIIHITRQLLSGLGAAHQAGAVHLDIKPDNVMLTRDHGGELVVKLVDFGISKRLNETDTEHKDDDAEFIVGSPDYMPPEQLRGGTVDVRTDLYATGVLLYEAITGRTPFDADHIEMLVFSILTDPVTAPSALRPDCPTELERVVLKAMSRDPAARYQSAEEMSRALAEVRATRAPQSSPSLARLSEHEARPRKSMRRRRTIDARTLNTLRVNPLLSDPPQVANSITHSEAPTGRPPALEQELATAAQATLQIAAPDARSSQQIAPSTSLSGTSLPPPADPSLSALSTLRTTPSSAGDLPSPRRSVPPSQRLWLGVSAALAIACLVLLGLWLQGRKPDANGGAPLNVPLAVTAAVAQPTPTPSPGPSPTTATTPSVAPAVAPAAADEALPSAPTARMTPAQRRAARLRASRQAAAHEATPVAHEAAPEPMKPPPPVAPPDQDPAITRAQLTAAAHDFAAGKDEQAIAIYRQLVKAAPREAEAWRGLAATANRMGERSEAERALRRYLQLRPNARDATRILQRPGNLP